MRLIVLGVCACTAIPLFKVTGRIVGVAKLTVQMPVSRFILILVLWGGWFWATLDSGIRCLVVGAPQ